jgi:hypothetical protein
MDEFLIIFGDVDGYKWWIWEWYKCIGGDLGFTQELFGYAE